MLDGVGDDAVDRAFVLFDGGLINAEAPAGDRDRARAQVVTGGGHATAALDTVASYRPAGRLGNPRPQPAAL